MLDVLLTASVSFIISFLAIPVVLQIAEMKNHVTLLKTRTVDMEHFANGYNRITGAKQLIDMTMLRYQPRLTA